MPARNYRNLIAWIKAFEPARAIYGETTWIGILIRAEIIVLIPLT
jgi:hypothetical protein